jgi:hypothetical protein
MVHKVRLCTDTKYLWILDLVLFHLHTFKQHETRSEGTNGDLLSTCKERVVINLNTFSR